MFERYTAVREKYAEVPYPSSEGTYGVSIDGQVNRNGKVVESFIDEEGDLAIHADLWHGKANYKVSLLSLFAYGKIKANMAMHGDVEPFHCDSDKTNLHPCNLGYRFKRPIPCSTMTGYFHIPFFDSFVINEKGTLRVLTSGKVVPWHVLKPKAENNPRNVKGGYVRFVIHSNVGAFGISRHRLLMFAFTYFPDNVDQLYVNHKNGIPGSDDLSNLEWVTPSENNIHAVETGLRSQNIRVYAKNIYSNEEINFASFGIMARYFKVPITKIQRRAKSQGQTLYDGGWLFKTDKDRPWREINNPEQELKAQSTATKVFSKNVFTGEIREHKSIAQCGIDLKFAEPQGPRHYILKNFKRPYYGYLFKTEYDKTPWPEFSERELAVFKDNPSGHARGVIACKPNGEELFFTNIIKAAEHFSHILKSKNDVIKAIGRCRCVDGYYLTYLQSNV